MAGPLVKKEQKEKSPIRSRMSGRKAVWVVASKEWI